MLTAGYVSPYHAVHGCRLTPAYFAMRASDHRVNMFYRKCSQTPHLYIFSGGKEGNTIETQSALILFYFFKALLNLNVDTLTLLQECLSGNQQNISSSTTCAQVCSYLVVNTALFILPINNPLHHLVCISLLHVSAPSHRTAKYRAKAASDK